jgi:hypothetical protein
MQTFRFGWICLMVLVFFPKGASASLFPSFSVEIVSDNGFKVSDYSGISITAISGTEFVGSPQNIDHVTQTAKLVETMNESAWQHLDDWIDMTAPDWVGKKPITVKVLLIDLQGAKYTAFGWLAPGMGNTNASAQYRFYLYDQKQEIAVFDVSCDLRTGAETAFHKVGEQLQNGFKKYLKLHAKLTGPLVKGQ